LIRLWQRHTLSDEYARRPCDTTLEDHGRLKHQDAVDAHTLLMSEINRTATPVPRRPATAGKAKSGMPLWATNAINRGQADSQPVTDGSYKQRLGEDHAHSRRRSSPLLERAELFQVLDGEQIERLAGNGAADKEPRSTVRPDVDGSRMFR